MVIPKINSTLLKDGENAITPIVLKGKSDEMDEQFIDKISQPLFKFNETALSIAQMEKDLETIKETAKKATTSEKTKTTKASKTKKTDKKVEKEVTKEPEKKIETPETKKENIVDKEEKAEQSAKERSKNRISSLEKLGFKYNKPSLSYNNNKAKITLKSINLLNDEQFAVLIKSELDNNKPEITEGAQAINAFNGNAENVGTTEINKEKKVAAAESVLKASKGESEGFDPFADDTEESTDVTQETKTEDVSNTDNTDNNDGEMQFF